MTDDSELSGLDPYELLDTEAARIDAYLASIPDDDQAWDQPTRCADWNRRQLLAHLASTESYHHACLDDTLDAFIAKGIEGGATDVTSFNALGVAEHEGREPSAMLAEWRDLNARTREQLRERGDRDMTTMVGPYPSRWQSFHVAVELATHADDLDVPVTEDEAPQRLAWRANVSRFVIAESKPDVSLSRSADGQTVVTGQGIQATVDDLTLVEGVAGRLAPSGPLDDDQRALLGATP